MKPVHLVALIVLSLVLSTFLSRFGDRLGLPLPLPLFTHETKELPEGAAAMFVGTLEVSFFTSDAAHARTSARHRTVYANDRGYQGMEDNDLRGNLDGTFKHGWNQPGQVHVRIGRRADRPRHGELELFRVLHRWDKLALVPGAQVEQVSLKLHLEEPVQTCQVLSLYEVNADWEPGGGGILRDNVSPPMEGEVWWNARAHEQVPWGLPGAGYAGATNDADTAEVPLAFTRICPGDEVAQLVSQRLDAYLERRASGGLPALFLLKLADIDEDRNATVMNVLSGSYGGNLNVAKRPSLEMVWRSEQATSTMTRDVVLERGRGVEFDLERPAHSTHVAVNFYAQGDSPSPFVELRIDGKWRAVERPLSVARTRVDGVRVTAGENVLALGEPFVDAFKDTWIRSAPPQEQKVPWLFVSPSGTRHEVFAQYDKDWWWKVNFTPNEVGRWCYRWRQQFTMVVHESAWACFDVVARTGESVLVALRDLLERARMRDKIKSSDPNLDLAKQFRALERAGLALQTPASWRNDRSAPLRELLRDVRGTLAGPVPDSIELVPNPPPDWAK